MMKYLTRFLPAFMFLLLSMTTVSSCDWEKLDRSPEPEHPLYVTYTISASSLDFTGPEQLLLDIQDWIKANNSIYDKQVNYKSGEASEFTQTDAEAVKKYEEFVPKFKAYLDNEVKDLLRSGHYGEPTATVSALFSIYAARTQGESGNLKYEQISFTYP